MKKLIEGSTHAQSFQAVIDPKTGVCQMQCRGCKKNLSAANMSATAKSHMQSCKGQQTVELLSDDEDEEQAAKQQKASAGSSGQKRQRQTQLPVLPADRLAAITRELLLFVVTDEFAFKKLNNKHLRRALALAGVHIPDEKVRSSLKFKAPD
jgi:hypothetical protein